MNCLGQEDKLFLLEILVP